MQHAFASGQKSKPGAEGNARGAPRRIAAHHGMSNHRVLQRRCACGAPARSVGECTECKATRDGPRVQRQALAINKPGDAFEQEADRIAEQVMRMAAPVGIEHEPAVQRSAAHQAAPETAPPIVHDVLRSPGQPLDATTRAFMEPRFGQDFSKVRVHTDTRAAESARAVNALAYTVGRDVVFAAGQYARSSAAGRELIAHELAHTLQQDEISAGPPAMLETADPATSVEREAEPAAAATRHESIRPSLARQPRIARQIVGQPATRQPETQAAMREQTRDSGGCTPGQGYPPGQCSAYLANAWWLPFAYVNNATCACRATPNVPTANCVRKFLQDRLAAKSLSVKLVASAMKVLELSPATYPSYELYVQTVLTPDIYRDHVDAYRSCCCPHGPAPYVDWIGVTSIPFQPCSLVGWFIRNFGSCTGAPDSW